MFLIDKKLLKLSISSWIAWVASVFQENYSFHFLSDLLAWSCSWYSFIIFIIYRFCIDVTSCTNIGNLCLAFFLIILVKSWLILLILKNQLSVSIYKWSLTTTLSTNFYVVFYFLFVRRTFWFSFQCLFVSCVI